MVILVQPYRAPEPYLFPDQKRQQLHKYVRGLPNVE